MAYLKETIITLCCLALMLLAGTTQGAIVATDAEPAASPVPFAFEENRGQLDSTARFAARGRGR